MRLVIRAFGLDLLDVELTTDTASDDGDYSRDLSGGNLGAYPIDAGPTDRYMGFTSGLEDASKRPRDGWSRPGSWPNLMRGSTWEILHKASPQGRSG